MKTTALAVIVSTQLWSCLPTYNPKFLRPFQDAQNMCTVTKRGTVRKEHSSELFCFFVFRSMSHYTSRRKPKKK